MSGALLDYRRLWFPIGSLHGPFMTKLPAVASLQRLGPVVAQGIVHLRLRLKKEMALPLCTEGPGGGQQGRAMDKKKAGVTHRCEAATAAVC